MMRNSLACPFLVGALLLGVVACSGPRPEDVPGVVESGPIDTVAARAVSGAPDPATRLAQTIGVVPLTARAPKTIPLTRPPEVISFYNFPRTSTDGLSYREGFYIHAVIREFSWGMDEVMHQDRLRLESLLNLRIDEDGQLLIDQAPLEPDQRTLSSMRGMAASAPWRHSDDVDEVETTVVFPNRNRMITTRSGAQRPRPTRRPSYTGTEGGPSPAEIESAIRAAERRLSESPAPQEVRP